MKLEDLLKEPDKDLALTKAIAAITIMREALEFYKTPPGIGHATRTTLSWESGTWKYDGGDTALKALNKIEGL